MCGSDVSFFMIDTLPSNTEIPAAFRRGRLTFGVSGGSEAISSTNCIFCNGGEVKKDSNYPYYIIIILLLLVLIKCFTFQTHDLNVF